MLSPEPVIVTGRMTGSPIGSGVANSVDLDHGFTGKFHDGLTGLTHHQHRWFDPALGKWISEDPLGLAAGDINTTRYVNNEPLTYTDPTGLFAEGLGDGNEDSAQGVPRNANFAQSDYAEEFSDHPNARFRGETIDSIAAKLKSGDLKPKDVPIQWGEIEKGKPLILNTRSAKALERAGIPREQWHGVDISDDQRALTRLRNQLRQSELGPDGTPNPRSRGTSGGPRVGPTIARSVSGLINSLNIIHEVLTTATDARENETRLFDQWRENYHNTPWVGPGIWNPDFQSNRGGIGDPRIN